MERSEERRQNKAAERWLQTEGFKKQERDRLWVLQREYQTGRNDRAPLVTNLLRVRKKREEDKG